jgi:hypothetical protein
MIGTSFRAQSGNIKEWIVIGSHGMFTDAWKCYPADKVAKGEDVKENIVQYFTTDFIKDNEIFPTK